MKLRTVILIVLTVLIADQALKIWVKTNMFYHEERYILGNWFRLYFIENEGMAYGWKFGGEWGKLILTLFRLVAVLFGTWYLKRIVEQKYHPGFIFCAALIYAGAAGNLIDSMFYGMIFTGSEVGAPLATLFPEKGYAGFLHGHVVDMLYFPIIDNKIMPSWMPFIGGKPFTFFQPIFNIADAAISVGIITILIFQKRFFSETSKPQNATTVETSAGVNDKTEVL
ncbi:MAG: lipoprotein signal peptidase [Lacibacter sp.]